jgi:GT2 family glycosyltransferase
LNKNADIAVIVITYNGRRHLKECFNALLEQTYKNFEIYLIDNASSDGSSSFVHENFPQVNIIRFEKNYGFAEGYNRAINRVNSKYTVLLNDDTKVDSKWLEELTKAMNDDTQILAAGSKIFFYDKPSLIQHAGGKFTITGAGIDSGFGEKDQVLCNKPKYAGMVCGCAMMLRKELFESLGGFDNQYFAYFEDVDICWRGWLWGYKTVYVPTSIVYHKFGGSWGKRSSHNRVFYGTKNRFANILKNFGGRNLILAVIATCIFDFVKVTSFLLENQKKSVLAVLKAYYQIFLNLPNYMRIRGKVQSKRKLSDKDLFKLGLFLTLPESLREFKRLQEINYIS